MLQKSINSCVQPTAHPAHTKMSNSHEEEGQTLLLSKRKEEKLVQTISVVQGTHPDGSRTSFVVET